MENGLNREKSRSIWSKMHSGIWLTPFGIYVMNWFRIRILHLMKSPKNPPHTYTLKKNSWEWFLSHRTIAHFTCDTKEVKILLANFFTLFSMWCPYHKTFFVSKIQPIILCATFLHQQRTIKLIFITCKSTERKKNWCCFTLIFPFLIRCSADNFH